MPRSSRDSRSIGAFCAVGLCIVTAAASSWATSASAASLLFVPHNGRYPYHFTGSAGESLLETRGGQKVTAERDDVLVLVLNRTLFDLNAKFLNVQAPPFGACNSPGAGAGVVEINLLGHFGFAQAGNHPAVLLLVPAGFEFACQFGLVKVKVRGAVIGTVTAPALNAASEELLIAFKQKEGVQEFTEFLLGEEKLLNQFLEVSIAGGEFEQAGLQGEKTLKALLDQGMFLLLTP